MASMKHRQASQHDFAMIPRSDVPRSRYMLQQTRKTTFDGGKLIPIYCEEILPGDHFNGHMSLFARLATPITPVLDNAELETFFFFVPNRLVWDNWEKFIAGESYTIPYVQSPIGGWAVGSLYDYFGIPPVGQMDPAYTTPQINALPFRAYNLIWNAWFKDQNLNADATVPTNDGPDSSAYYVIANRNKKHDYFTSSLPWPQKGTAVTLPLGTTATVKTSSSNLVTGAQIPAIWHRADGGMPALGNYMGTITDGGTAALIGPTSTAAATGVTGGGIYPTNLFADLSTATAATVNALRTAFQVQRLLERDARGGTRYIELLQAHFGVRPPDFRLQRPEYIGGGKTMINTHPIAQTSATGTTPQGNLAAFSTAQGGAHRFNYAATEHGYIIGLVNVRTDLTYQQGLRRHWRRSTRYDYYFPAFAHLGEQAVLRSELYMTGDPAVDNAAFGYQERWAEYRYTPNEITGLFRSTSAGNIDEWHYAEQFGSTPALNGTFIGDPSGGPLLRSFAAGALANGQQVLLDTLFRVTATRPMPTYSVPGLIDHF